MRPRLTYANAMATVAVFIALGGSAYAFHLGRNSVGAKQLKKSAVTTAKIKNAAVTAAKVKAGTLTGTQVKASTLGTVPNAVHAERADAATSLPPAEAWHAVGGPGEPQFQNGCHNVGLPNSANVRFYRDQIGIVHLEGIYNGCSSEGEIAFQLPAGYRPGPNLNFSLPLFGNEGAVVVHGGAPGIPPHEAGAVRCAVVICILDGVAFRAES